MKPQKKQIKKPKEEAIEFQAIRPFGPTIIRGTLPKHLIELMDTKATEMLENEKLSKEFDHSGSLAGNVKQEVRFHTEWMDTNEFLPMIGFLGTVIGMIVAFHEMASAGGNIDVEMLSKGIYTAMVTTVAGLVVGIIAYIAYNYLVTKVEKVIFQMEARTTEFLDHIHHSE